MHRGARRFVLPFAAVFWLTAAGAAVAGPPPSQAPTSTSLTASPQSAAVGQPVTLTATVTQSSGVPTGAVSFAGLDGFQCQSQPLDASGQATCTTSFSQARTYTLSAHYSGSGSSQSSTSPSVAYSVSGTATTVSLRSSTSSPATGTAFILTATVVAAQSDSTPMQGNVQFLDNGSPVNGCENQPVVTKQGQPPYFAQCQLNYGTAGSHSYVAHYLGDGHYGAAASAPLALSVGVAGQGALAACPGQDAPFPASGMASARGAVVCLINEVRARYGLDPVTESPRLDADVQNRPGQPPRLQGIKGGSVLFTSTGTRTPYQLVADWLRFKSSCFDLLAPRDQIGVGVLPVAMILGPLTRGLAYFGEGPSWTVALLATSNGLASSPSASMGCPHPLPVDAAGQGAARRGPASDLLVAGAATTPDRRSLILGLAGQQRQRFRGLLSVRVGGAYVATVRLGVRYGPKNLRLRLTRAATRALGHGRRVVSVAVTERSPRRATYVFELEL